MADGGISLGALGLIAGGVILAYAGVQDPPGGPVGVVRDILQGKEPQRGVQKSSVGGAAGGAAGRAVNELVRQGLINGYQLGPVRADVAAVAAEVGPKFGIKTIGGWRRTDQFPDHPQGRALDFMVNNAGGKTTGDAVAGYLIANAARFRMDYIIWDHRSWNPRRGTWAAYTSTNNPHTDHVHFSAI